MALGFFPNEMGVLQFVRGQVLIGQHCMQITPSLVSCKTYVSSHEIPPIWWEVALNKSFEIAVVAWIHYRISKHDNRRNWLIFRQSNYGNSILKLEGEKKKNIRRKKIMVEEEEQETGFCEKKCICFI